MAGRGIFGSSFIMQNAFHFKGEQTKIKSKERLCIPVSRKELAEPVDPSASAAAVMGALPACLDVSVLTPSMRAVLGAVCVSAGVRVTQDPESGAFVAGYILTLLRLVNGAGKKGWKTERGKTKTAHYIFDEKMDSCTWYGKPVSETDSAGSDTEGICSGCTERCTTTAMRYDRRSHQCRYRELCI